MHAVKRYLVLVVLLAGCGAAAADTPNSPDWTGGYVCVGGTPIHTVPPPNTWECDGEWRPFTGLTSVP